MTACPVSGGGKAVNAGVSASVSVYPPAPTLKRQNALRDEKSSAGKAFTGHAQTVGGGQRAGGLGWPDGHSHGEGAKVDRLSSREEDNTWTASGLPLSWGAGSGGANKFCCWPIRRDRATSGEMCNRG